MTWWDKFVKTTFPSLNLMNEGNELYFKQPVAEAFLNFREVTQILDLLLLNVETLQYDASTLAASLIYLVVGKAMGIFSKSDLIKKSRYLQSQDLQRFNEVFELFLKQYNGPELENVLSLTEYVRPFFAVDSCTEFSEAVKENARFEVNIFY